MTPLEAMATGLPVVATIVGAFPHLITSDNGVLVEPGNAGDLAVAVKALLDEAIQINNVYRSILLSKD